MKKITRFLVAVFMILTMAVSVIAAPPSPGTQVKPNNGEITLGDGTVIQVDNPDELAQYIEITESEVKPQTMPGHNSLATVDVTLAENVDSMNIVLYVPGVKKGDVIVVRMLVNGQWVNVEAVVIDDNKVQVTLTESGTFEILKKSTGSGSGTGTESDSDSGNSQSGENTSSTSPKTGETHALPAAYVAVGILGAVAVFAGYKAKKSVK